jgi:beta-N-acetylhexosaminidase
MHPKRVLLLILLAAVIPACQTPKKSQSESPPRREHPEVSMEVLPGKEHPAADKLDRMVLPAFPAEADGMRERDEIVERVLRQLTLRQKIGQRFITGFSGRRMTNSVKTLIEEGCIGGIMLTRANVQNAAQLKELVVELQTAAGSHEPGIGLLIAVDQEGGRVTRLDFDTLTRFPPPFYWGAYQDPFYVEAAAYVISREALSLGCNINLAPVLDLYDRPDDSIVGDRSMGINPVQVGERGVYYLFGAQRAGIATAAKHFPGHGRTTVDSHRELPVVEVSEEVLLNHDLLPFQMAIRHGVDAIMTAHILYPQIDPDFPVTLSETFLRDLLRERMGFKGVIISDDIEMGALRSRFSPQEIIKHGINAGVDILLEYGSLDVLQLIDEAHTMVLVGEIDGGAIDEGARRILRLKWKYGLL